MWELDKLYSYGRDITSQDIISSYVLLGFKYKLPNYKIYESPILVNKINLPSYANTFLIKHKKVLGISQTTDKVDYIILRSLSSKEFLTLENNRAVPYGLPTFQNFYYGMPIILVEGLKDRDCIAQIYPYVLALQTSGLSSLNLQILSSITNKVILMYDNDERGTQSSEKDYFTLKKMNFKVDIINHPEGIKDSGELIDILFSGDNFKFNWLYEYYKTKINGVIAYDFTRIST